jgi:hypothetical protein
MEASLQKLMQPQRLTEESFEDYQLRRRTAHQYNQVAAKGKYLHVSKWFTPSKDKNGNDTISVHHSTYVKPL